MDYDHDANAISKIGLGCVTFGREIDKGTSFTLMDHAYKNGITFFDTAAAYGNGVSEEIVGKWLKERTFSKKSVTIATKILPPYTPSQICLSLEESLKRLRTESIDILYLHRWDEILNNTEAWITLDKLVKEGKVKKTGVSNFDTEQLLNAVNLQIINGLESIRYIQNNNNFAISDLSNGIRETCRSNGIKIVTFSPLGAGFLTGKHKHGVQQGSRFADIPAHQDIYFNEHAKQRLDKILQVAERTGYSSTHLALSWALHQKDVFLVLVGGRTIAHLDQAFAAAKFYSPEILSELDSI